MWEIPGIRTTPSGCELIEQQPLDRTESFPNLRMHEAQINEELYKPENLLLSSESEGEWTKKKKKIGGMLFIDSKQ